MITRFAPSPTGPLHIGHAFSAITAHDRAIKAGGTFLLRIEDIDRSRARPEWEALITKDLAWLGLSWPLPVLRQSDNQTAYTKALQALWDQGLLYPCHCTRKDIAAAAASPQEGAPLGPDGVIYPGTCRQVPPEGPLPQGVHLRLNSARALESLGPLDFTETGSGPKHETGEISLSAEQFIQGIGDVVLSRKDMGTSYHLSVVVDDAAHGITEVARGADLFEATPIHVLLQRLLDLPTPLYHHHRLIRDDSGKRLAKRDDARSIESYRNEGLSPEDIRQMIGLSRG
ncbi:tRNA glutamyl-Q(34) synthetase GluQRS [Alphaproteobacteria bacterium KMM 3653]|uniref:tRNA glutamyl-Q(34) synthetase GluQRS n=1 Tax=Harenicola maris TaxID=2841044 RepID=A0AAP2CN09_9RHOB|nr:tRNA glutamyl-Q(34) synthetase GluQRS [Harenicola maris]